MKLEVGKRYIDGAGRICVVEREDGYGGMDRFKVSHEGYGDIWHYEDGRSNLGDLEDLRIVSDVADTVSKFKVGDRVRVVGNKSRHRFNIGEVVEIINAFSHTYHAKNNEEDWGVSFDDVTNVNTLQLNETYTNANGDKWECIAIKGDVAWLAAVYGDRLGTGYKFHLDGTPICLFSPESPYRIVFEPVVETLETTVTIEGQPVRLEYTKTDGVFDYASVTLVVPF